jgi:hypothetical protein
VPDPKKTLKLDQIKVDYDFRPVSNGYYQDSKFDEILHEYRDRLNDSVFCFPIGALRCIDRLLHLSHNRLFLLSADKGRVWEHDLHDGLAPKPVLHDGCFSLSVNFHAIGRYFQNKKGSICLYKKFHDEVFCISGFVADDRSQSYPATRFAFAEHIEKLGPAEIWAAYTAIAKNIENTPLPILLSAMRMSDYDPKAFKMFSDAFLNLTNNITIDLESDLLQVLDRIWENFYLMNDSLQDADAIARCYYRCHRYTKCLSIYTNIVKNYGETPLSLCAIALCLYKLNMVHQALPFLKRVLEIDSTSSFARNWISRMEYELKQMGSHAPEIPKAAVLQDIPELPVLPQARCQSNA